MIKPLLNPLFLLLLLTSGPLFASAGSLQMRLNGNRLSLQAEQSSLEDVLNEFIRLGVSVRIDPGVQAAVNGRLTDVPLDEALDQLLRQYGYVTRWDMIDGPMGQIPKLAEIDVYRRGYHRSMRPMPDPFDGTFDVVVDPDGSRYVRDELLLGLKSGTTREQFDSLLASVNAAVVGSVGDRGIYRIKLARKSHVPTILKQFNAHPIVAAVEANHVYSVPPAESSGPTPSSAPPLAEPLEAAEGASLVAVLDSGMSSSLNMGGLLKGTFDATRPGSAINDPVGHGTQMALIASGMTTPTGVAPSGHPQGVPLLMIKAFDEEGHASNFSMMESIDYALENDARILSMSWATEVESPFLSSTIRSALDSQLIIVAAAGNEPSGIPSYPASFKDVIAVGALNGDGALWEKSNRGYFIDVVAPGAANLPVGYNGPPGSYAGTSIATPWVARALSQYISANPNADNETVKKAFFDSLTDAGVPGRDDLYGRGSFDDAARKRFLK